MGARDAPKLEPPDALRRAQSLSSESGTATAARQAAPSFEEGEARLGAGSRASATLLLWPLLCGSVRCQQPTLHTRRSL